MAGDSSSSSSLALTEIVDISYIAIEEHWEIEVSRFFNFPSLPSTSLLLKPLRKSIVSRLEGTWLSSSSTASLRLLTSHSTPEMILVVSLRGKILEEHFVSNLHFSWPQVSCVYQCPTKASRVVFASYRDGIGQIQKFAMRFSTSSEAEKFLNVLKESLKDLINSGSPQSNTKSEISSQSAFSSNRLQCRAEKDASYATPEVSHVTPHVTYTPQMLLLDNKAAQATPAPAHNFESIFSALPPSFTALLASCCTEAEQEQPRVPEEVDLKTQITRCMLDSSFNDILTEVEKFISKTGGDLAI